MERRRGLLDAHAAKKTHLHHFALPGVDRLQRIQRIVERREILEGCAGHFRGVVKRNLMSPGIALLIALRARSIYQNAPHEAGGHRKEMRAILPLDLFDFDEPEVRLIDQRGRLERVAGTLVAHMAPCQPAQFGVDQREQAVERRHLTLPPGLQQSGWVGRVTWNAVCAGQAPCACFSLLFERVDPF
jgi:hypothetical protein